MEETSKAFESVLINIPSLSPMTGVKLCEIEHSLRTTATAGQVDKDTKRKLLQYADAVKEVSRFTVLHQKAVLERFQFLIECGKREKEKGR